MEESNGAPLVRFLSAAEGRYFTERRQIACLPCEVPKPRDSILFRVDTMTFEEEAPRKEALENVLSSTRIRGVNFLYLLTGGRDGVKFYYGLSRSLSEQLESALNVPEIGESVLQATLRGNFRGSQVAELTGDEKKAVLDRVGRMTEVSRIEGVAGSVKDDEAFQSVDRLVDVMQGEEYCLLIIAKALQPAEVSEIEQRLYKAYSLLSPLAKLSRQDGQSHGTSSSITDTDSTSKGESSGRSESKGSSTSKSTGTNSSTGCSYTETTSAAVASKATQIGKSTVKNGITETGSETTTIPESPSVSNARGTSKSKGASESTQSGTNESTQTSTGENSGVSHSTAKQTGENEGVSTTVSREEQDKQVQEWIQYCDDVIFPRLDYGRGKGIFISACYVMSKSKVAQIKLENTVLSLYSGKQGNRLPLRAFPLDGEDPERAGAFRLQFPMGRFRARPEREELLARALLSQYAQAAGATFPLGSWITTNELSMIAGLPRKEVIGMQLREEVEFGLNVPVPKEADRIALGSLVQNGVVVGKGRGGAPKAENPAWQIPVYLDRRSLDKHMFVAGVTGSGKTTTCQKLLIESGLPFLVIEPAKTEYRLLKQKYPDLLVFTLGNDDAAPFRLNPLEFFPGESIVSHVDMLKASLEAAFDMEAAIPQLIERALYKCYEDYGWDISQNVNRFFPDGAAFESDVFAFPTFSDLLAQIPKVVKEQEFDDRLKNDYIGSIRARLQSLVLGAKGLMLNTRRSVDFRALLDRKVVFELENLRNGGEKALVMGFILAAFNEAVRERYFRNRKTHPHILLVEEAHRLLSRAMPGDSPNKKQGVETFADMLAEIRKYGECLIIADQIPNKLTPDVLKNTNTKIVHRIFAQDDKEAIGSTMALKEEQRNFLSSLETGRAVVFSDGFGQAVQAQVWPSTDTGAAAPRDDELWEGILDFYTHGSTRQIMLPVQGGLDGLTPAQKRNTLTFLRLNIPTAMLAAARAMQWRSDYAEMLAEMYELKLTDPKALADWVIRYDPRLKPWPSEAGAKQHRKTLEAFFAAYPQGQEAVCASGFYENF